MFKLYPLIGRNSHLSIENKVLLHTAVMRPIIAYASPVWGYAAKTNINILDTLQNSLIRMIVKATRYMRNDDILQTPKKETPIQRNRAVWLRLPKRKHSALPCPAVKTRSLPGITEDLKPGSNLP
ncbi:RNA-directed DNA polymerase from mobile element jockey [Trichonephila clavipes]|nr:RNA-directed DNA polymerase from mobile element jockey [Trichonephila clavipes]